MKTLKGLPVEIPRDTDESNFPFHNIQNETDTLPGTPIIREVWGDILINLYKLLIETGITPTETEDGENSQYQILEALKKLPNELNDVEQVLTLTNTTWSVNMAIDLLPDKYIFIARATEDYNDAVNYTITGTDTNSYNVNSPNGFSASDVVLVVLDQSGARIIGLTKSNITVDVFTVFGTPVVFNDSNKMYYEEAGALLTDTPSIDYLESTIRVAEGDGTLVVYNMFVMQGHILCFCYLPSAQTYKFYQFNLTDLSTAVSVAITGITIPIGSNNEPYVFTNGNTVFVTNQAGTTVNDYELAELTYDASNQSLTLSVSRVLANTFQKTTNVVIQNNDLVTFIAGSLKKYDLTSGIETQLDDYNSYVGTIFRFNGETYYSNGEVAKKWTV
ncbi:hypothetical protein [Flagellimonas nanhaiensis]|uniref:Uncharacterized protein n=1 Tax=Flagellimonas nanhaiensis TaxID=2292706 RepID=A0A371JL97_9FLAO|nr:hypothetical protein [Allomuricauda nanhaiensis]RDY57718.1 hypothetical protein DX873_17620 [Allomuricauda nanhaiensis]